MNEIAEEWQEEGDWIRLSLPLARKYREHETLFLCRIPAFNIVGQSQITHISPSGEHVLITFYANAYWVKLSDLKVVDVLTPMTKEKTTQITEEEMEKATKAMEAYKKLQAKYPKKGPK